MDFPFLMARALHIVLGAFWVGALVFNAAFLFPAMAEAGPEAANVGAGLMRRRFLDVMPVMAIVTVLSGFYLLWRASGGFSAEYFRTSAGMTYSLGAVLALVALSIGAGILRPSMLRAAALSKSAAGMSPENGARAQAEAGALRARAGALGKVVAWLLGISTLAMALARYI